MLDDLTTLTDRELLQRHVAGDGGAAFGELFRRHRDRMYAVALRTTSNRELAADAVQDAFISAFRRADAFRGEAAVTTWLHRIVVNACLDRLRREKVSVRRAGDLGELDLPDLHDRHASVEARLDVREALARLPEGQRMALVLVDMHGLPVAEAAEVLGVAEGTVKSRCFRGREALAEMLGGREGPHGSDRNVDAGGDRTAGASRSAPTRQPWPARRNRRGPRDVPSAARLLCPVPPRPTDTPRGHVPEDLVSHPHDDSAPVEHDPTGMRALLASLPDPGPMPDDLVARISAALQAEADRGDGVEGLLGPRDDDDPARRACSRRAPATPAPGSCRCTVGCGCVTSASRPRWSGCWGSAATSSARPCPAGSRRP